MPFDPTALTHSTQQGDPMTFHKTCLRRSALMRLLALAWLVVSFMLPVSASAQSFRWVRQFGTDADDEVNAVAVSAAGVFAGGETTGTFPGQGSAGGVDAFVARYDIAGNQLWVRQFGSSASDYVYGLAADSTGVYAVGTTNGTLPGKTRVGNSDIFIRKYSPAGTELWTQQLGSSDQIGRAHV